MAHPEASPTARAGAVCETSIVLDDKPARFGVREQRPIRNGAGLPRRRKRLDPVGNWLLVVTTVSVPAGPPVRASPRLGHPATKTAITGTGWECTQLPPRTHPVVGFNLAEPWLAGCWVASARIPPTREASELQSTAHDDHCRQGADEPVDELALVRFADTGHTCEHSTPMPVPTGSGTSNETSPA